MTSVSVHDFRIHLDQYLEATATGDVVVTQNGEPWIVLRAVEKDQDRLSAAYANSPDFQRLIEQRRREQSVSWEQVKERLDAEP